MVRFLLYRKFLLAVVMLSFSPSIQTVHVSDWSKLLVSADAAGEVAGLFLRSKYNFKFVSRIPFIVGCKQSHIFLLVSRASGLRATHARGTRAQARLLFCGLARST